MEELFFGTEKFISSKRASKLTGYTTDYVGQLCRAEKIKSKLIGRNWYVNEVSLLEHKQECKKDQTVNNKELSQYAYEPLQYVAEERNRGVKTGRYTKSAVLNYELDSGALNPNPQKLTAPSGVEISKITLQKKEVQVCKQITPSVQLRRRKNEPQERLSKLSRKTTFPSFIKFGAGFLVVAGLVVSLLVVESATSYSATGTGKETTASRVQLADVFAVFRQ